MRLPRGIFYSGIRGACQQIDKVSTKHRSLIHASQARKREVLPRATLAAAPNRKSGRILLFLTCLPTLTAFHNVQSSINLVSFHYC